MLNATFRQLQAFVLAAQEGTFAAAADHLGISPAAVSDHIRNLEKKIGAPLFDRRSGGSPTLSEKGRALLNKAPTLLAHAQEVADLAEATPPRTMKAKVGAGEYILEHVLYPNLPRFQLEHPDIQIEISRVMPNFEGARAAQEGRCDLVYLSLQPDFESPPGELLGHVRRGLFVSSSHPIAKSWAGPGSQRLPVILPLSGSSAEEFGLKALSHAGVTDFEVVTRAEHSHTQLALTLAGVGACCLFYELAQEGLDSGRLVDLGVELPLLSRRGDPPAERPRYPTPAHRRSIRRRPASAVGACSAQVQAAKARRSSSIQFVAPRPSRGSAHRKAELQSALGESVSGFAARTRSKCLKLEPFHTGQMIPSDPKRLWPQNAAFSPRTNRRPSTS